MALSPSIPTSFVPKQPITTAKRRYSGGNNILLILSILILGIAILASAGVFLYGQYLTSVENSKAAELVRAQKSASSDTIDQFLRLSNRFVAAKSVLNRHIELSQFYTLLGNVTVQSVHFDSLDITVADDRSAQIAMVGQAKDFNALASESSVFAGQKYIKSAIFSGISVNKDSSVSFTLNANLDPGIVIEGIAPTTATGVSPSATTTIPVTPTILTSTTTSSTTLPAAPSALKTPAVKNLAKATSTPAAAPNTSAGSSTPQAPTTTKP